MRFIESRISKLEHGVRRHEGDFQLSDGRLITFFFSFRDEFEGYESKSSDHWLLLGITAAFILDEPYHHRGEACPELLRNARSLIRQWQDFFPGRKNVEIDAVAGARREARKGQRLACFYTGGVDSSFTYARRSAEIDLLLTASFDWGNVTPAGGTVLDLPPVHKASSLPIARVQTNLLSPFPEWGDAWGYLAHGPALASIAHLFSGGVDHAIISSSHAFGELIAWGSHPLTDPLLSSSSVSIEHYGATFSRLDKVGEVATSQAALKELTVCGMPPARKAGRANCSKCQKCLRTMIALELYDVDRSFALTFDWSDFTKQRLRHLRVHHPNEYIFMQELLEKSERENRSDIADVTRDILRRSRPYLPFALLENHVRHRYPKQVAKMKFLKVAKKRFYQVLAPH